MSTPPPATPAARSSDGYLAATVGALLGLVVVGGVATAIGVWLAILAHDPEADLATNLGNLIYPVGLGGLGAMGGIFFGTRGGLRRGRHAHAESTARLTTPLSALALVLTLAWGTGLVLLPAVAPVARWLTLRRAANA